MDDLLKLAPFIFEINLNFESSNSAGLSLAVNNCGLVAIGVSLEVLHLDVLVRDDRLHNSLNLWELLLNGRLQMVCKTLILILIMLCGGIMSGTVDAIFGKDA